MLRHQSSNDSFNSSFEEDEDGDRGGDGESSFHEQRRRRYADSEEDREHREDSHDSGRSSQRQPVSLGAGGSTGNGNEPHRGGYDSNQRHNNRRYPQQPPFPNRNQPHNQRNMQYNNFPNANYGYPPRNMPFPQGPPGNFGGNFGGSQQGGWDGGPQYPPNPNYGGHAFGGGNGFNQPKNTFGGNMPNMPPAVHDGFYGGVGGDFQQLGKAAAPPRPPLAALKTETSDGQPQSGDAFNSDSVPHPPAGACY